MRRVILPAVLASMVAGAMAFTTAPLPLGSAGLAARAKAGLSKIHPGYVAAAAPALRLSGGATQLQAAVLDGIKATDIDGKEVDLGKYAKVPAVLVVNLASAWGLTASNYAELVELTSQISSDKLAVLGFPCNQFGGQEPGSNAEIKAFARGKGAKFDLFAKIDVNGPDTHPLYQKLKSGAGNKTLFSVLGGADIKWNFAKFLISNGETIKRYEPTTSPKAILPDIESAINKARVA